MGLTTWAKAPSGKILKTDVAVAKNYLTEEELVDLGRIVSAYLDLAESRAKRRVAMTMEDWAKRLDIFLAADEREVLQDAGRISAEIAREHAEGEFSGRGVRPFRSTVCAYSTNPFVISVMTNDSSASIVSKVLNYPNVHKNAGVGYGDYIEQITYLLFLKLAPPSLKLRRASCEMSERGSCQLRSFLLEGRRRKGLNGGKPAGSELFGGEQGRGIGADVLQCLTHLLELEDSFEELEFVDERPLGAEPGEGVLKRIAEMFRQKLAEHRDMFFVLAPCLVEAEQAVAFALEEGKGIDDR